MVTVIENRFIRLDVHPELGLWKVEGKTRAAPKIENIQVNLWCRRGGSRFRFGDHWRETDQIPSSDEPTQHGEIRKELFEISSARANLRTLISFALPKEYPFLLWRVEIENRGVKPINVENIEMLTAGFFYRERRSPPGVIQLRHPISSRRTTQGEWADQLAFYSHGWQSWSYSGVYSRRERYQSTRLGPLRMSVIQNPGTPRPRRKGLFASDMFGVLGDRRSRNAVLAGFLSQRQHFGSLECWIGNWPPALRMWANGDDTRLDPGKKMVTDWAYLQFHHLDDTDPLETYTSAVAREHGLSGEPVWQSSPAGWCSWYQFSSEDYAGALTAHNIRENLSALVALREALPLDVLQVDDGYEAEVGDWDLFNASFPEGVAPLAAEIREAGFKPGLWLAPFIVHSRSRLAHHHPEWLLRNRLGLPVNAGYLWGSFARALDLSRPEVNHYIQGVIDTAVRHWGFTYLKLDFLYAAALRGQYHDPTRTRAQVLRAALESIRAAAGEETFLLGCGCPLGPAIGQVDAMRIGADTARRWYPSYKGIELVFKSERTFPAARYACHNSLTRAAFHRYWWINDPDCLLVRPETELTLCEVQTVASVIALTGGSCFLSDHLPALPPERLRIARCLLPLIGKTPSILDWFDKQTPEQVGLELRGPSGHWYLVGLFNWSDRVETRGLSLQELTLPTGKYFAREFWSAAVRSLDSEHPVVVDIEPHGVALFSLRLRDARHPVYLGGDFHISQGLEVKRWVPNQNSLFLQLEHPGVNEGCFDLFVPWAIQHACLNGDDLIGESLDSGVYRFRLKFNTTTGIEIKYGPRRLD